MNKKDVNALSEIKETNTPVPTEIVEATNSGFPATKEDLLKVDAKLGLEEMTQEDMPTPTLMLIQNNSTLVDDNGRPYPRGKFLYKGTKELYDEVSCSLLSFTKKDMPSFSDKEILERTYVFLGVLEPTLRPFILYLRSTGIGAAKQFLGEVVARNVPMYSLQVKLSSESVKGEKGTYYKIKFTVAGFTDDYKKLAVIAGLTRKYAHKVKEETPEAGEKDIPL